MASKTTLLKDLAPSRNPAGDGDPAADPGVVDPQAVAPGEAQSVAGGSEPVAAGQVAVYASFAEAFFILFAGLVLLKAALGRSGRQRTLTLLTGGALMFATIHGVVAASLFSNALAAGAHTVPLLVEAAAWFYLLPVLIVALDIIDKPAQPLFLGALVAGMLVSGGFIAAGFAGAGLVLSFVGAASAKLLLLLFATWFVYSAGDAAAAAGTAERRVNRGTASGLSPALVSEASARSEEAPFDPFGEPAAAPRKAGRPAASEPQKPAVGRRPASPEPVAAGNREAPASRGKEASKPRPPSNPEIKIKAPPKPRKRF